MRKTAHMLKMEERYGMPIEELLTLMLSKNGYSYTAAAKELGNMNAKTLWNWAFRMRIQVTKTLVTV